MVGLRNRIVHAYFDINADIVWTIAARDVPELIPMLEHALTRAASD